ncbi:MAG: hypothetical protein U5K31_02925 [Balneolaceae bacterium]|nr:hypothetical protein [Balneolaceae bacterium]
MPVNDTKEVLAVFDFDGTITSGDTLLPWLWHLKAHPLSFSPG